MFDILKISEELNFDIEDTIDLVNIMNNILNVNTSDDIIQYWQNYCFRADNFDEIIRYFDDIKDIKEIGARVFVLGSGKLVYIGHKYSLFKYAKENNNTMLKIILDNF